MRRAPRDSGSGLMYVSSLSGNGRRGSWGSLVLSRQNPPAQVLRICLTSPPIRGRAIRQQVDHPATLQVRDDRSVVHAFPPRPLIDASDTDHRAMRPGSSTCFDTAQDGGAARRHPEPGQPSLGWSPTRTVAKQADDRGQAGGPSRERLDGDRRSLRRLVLRRSDRSCDGSWIVFRRQDSRQAGSRLSSARSDATRSAACITGARANRVMSVNVVEIGYRLRWPRIMRLRWKSGWARPSTPVRVRT